MPRHTESNSLFDDIPDSPMEMAKGIITDAFAERDMQTISLLNGNKHTITRPDGTQYRPYARILVQPTILEVARNYSKNFIDLEDVDVAALKAKLSKSEMEFLEDVIASAFLEGGMFCACGGGVGRRAAFIKLAEKLNYATSH